MCHGLYVLPNQNFNLNIGDFYMLIAVISCGLGYAEGGKTLKRLRWLASHLMALVITLPLMSIEHLLFPKQCIQTAQILGLIYVSVFSMWLAFYFGIKV